MPKANPKKIKSALSPARILIALSIIAILAVITSWLAGEKLLPEDKAKLVAPNGTYSLDLAQKQEDQEKGLGGRDALNARGGMLFVYGSEAERCFWMKDMQFSIDIIWLDARYRITQLRQNVSPSDYPKTYCHNAKYVLELKAGEAAKNGYKAGSLLHTE